MMKKFNLFILIFILLLGTFGIAYMPIISADSYINPINIRAYGDSISAGYGLDDFVNYLPKDSGLPKTSVLTKNCFTDYFAKPYLEVFGGSAVGYGVDGYESTDLVEVLQPYQSGVAGDYQDFLNTDIFTLCIGANNVMHIAEANFNKYLEGTISDSEYRKLLSDAVDVFEEDYNQVILPTLTQNNAYVLVMTIYNPFRFASLKDITVNTGSIPNDASIKTFLYALDVTFQEYLETTMIYLQKINQIIRDSESQNVYVADVWQMCENLTKSEHLEYFNVDPSKIVITEAITEISWGMFLEHCDPHPEEKGHQAIAQEFAKQFKYFQFALKTDLSTINYSNQSLIFNINTIQTEKYVYKVIKKVNSQNEQVYTADANIFEIPAHNFNGQNQVFVQVYHDNSMIFETKAISFNLSVVQEPTPQTPQQTQQQTSKNQLSTLEISMLCIMSILSFIILALVVRIVIKKFKA